MQILGLFWSLLEHYRLQVLKSTLQMLHLTPLLIPVGAVDP